MCILFVVFQNLSSHLLYFTMSQNYCLKFSMTSFYTEMKNQGGYQEKTWTIFLMGNNHFYYYMLYTICFFFYLLFFTLYVICDCVNRIESQQCRKPRLHSCSFTVHILGLSKKFLEIQVLSIGWTTIKSFVLEAQCISSFHCQP